MIKKSPVNGKSPKIHPTAFIAEDAVIIGDVTIGAYVNIWYGAKLRGDGCTIIVGENTSIQDNCVVHSEPGSICKIGADIIVGHMAMVHGPCEIGDYSMVGLKSTVLQHSKMGKGSVLAGGALLIGEAEDFSLYAGVPAVKKKDYGEKRIEAGKKAAQGYVTNGQKFKEKGYSQIVPEEFLMKD